MKCKLLLLDMDGTTVNSRLEITKRTCDAVIRLAAAGTVVAIVSGRPTFGLLTAANMLELRRYGGYLVAYNGGSVYACKSKETILDQALPVNTAGALQRVANASGCSILSYSGDAIVTDAPDCSYHLHEAEINGMRIKYAPDFSIFDTEKLHKCLFSADPEVILRAEACARNALPDGIEFYRSDPFFLEVVPRGVNKGVALQWLAERLHIDQKDAVACGNGLNDIAMFRAAGFGIAMGDAQEELIREADYVSKSCDEEGVAHALETLFL